VKLQTGKILLMNGTARGCQRRIMPNNWEERQPGPPLSEADGVM